MVSCKVSRLSTFWNTLLDTSGRVTRCVQGTKIGQICVDSCSSKGEDYFWCWTNAHKWGPGEVWWNYCGVNGPSSQLGGSLNGHTVKGVPCVAACGQQGESYWWCRDDSHKTDSWDYCSPPGQVRAVQYTRHGHQCLGECGQHGENYWWCQKSVRYGPENGNDDRTEDYWWEYCSPTKHRTRYNLPCTDPCASRGEKYFWCHTETSWDYCSPEPTATEELVTKGGLKCNGVCDKMSSSYTFCETKQATGIIRSWWDYCTPK